MKPDMLDSIVDDYTGGEGEVVRMDGLDECVVGINLHSDIPRLCYSYNKLIEHFKDDGCEDDMEAIEYIEYNIVRHPSFQYVDVIHDINMKENECDSI